MIRTMGRVSLMLAIAGLSTSVVAFALLWRFEDLVGPERTETLMLVTLLWLALTEWIAFVLGFAARPIVHGRIGMAVAAGSSLGLLVLAPLTVFLVYWSAALVACAVVSRVNGAGKSVHQASQ